MTGILKNIWGSLSLYNGHFLGELGGLRRENFEDEGIGDSLPLTLQRTFLRRNAGNEMKNFQKKYTPLLLRKRERIISADMRFERIASTSGVRTHRKNEQFSLAPDLLILLLGKPHTPFMSKLKILPELFGKSLAFIRFDDYNYTVIL